MTTPIGSRPRPRWQLPAAALAMVFGLATIIAGGRVVLGSAVARAAAGDYVPFVLWFNFLAGFMYVATGILLALGRPAAAKLAFAIAVGTGLVYAAFGIHVLIGGAFTVHTVMAMTLRTTIWVGIAALACRQFGCPRRKRAAGAMVVMTIVLVGLTTCGPPSSTVKMHAGSTASAAPGRPLAPRMTVKDHKERELELPVQGRVTVLSFASRSTADRASETNTDKEVQLAVIDGDGRIVSFFTATPSAADVAAGIARANGKATAR